MAWGQLVVLNPLRVQFSIKNGTKMNLIKLVPKWLIRGWFDQCSIICGYWQLQPHRFRRRLKCCPQDSGCRCLMHLKRKMQAELCLHCRQRNEWRNMNAWPSCTILNLQFYCWQTITVWPFLKLEEISNSNSQNYNIVPVHQSETRLVLVAIPELAQLWKWRSCQSHVVPSAALLGKLRLVT